MWWFGGISRRAQTNEKKRGIDFTTHVIGFDLKEGEEKQLRCLAESTGGQFFAAKDAAGLQEALGTAVQAASKPVEHNLLLTGKEAETDKLLRDGIKWSIYSSKEDEHPKETLTGPKARFKLEPGTYTVSGTWKDITAEKQITVVEDKVTEEEFVFGVGRLKVSGRQSEGGKKITEKIEWNVYKKQESSDERAEHVALTYGSSREFRLPPGDYVVEGTLGGTKSEKITSLQSGKTSELVLIFGVGTLKLSAFKSEGGTKITRNIGWQLYEQLENGERGKRLQVFGGATKTMPLATGSYVVEGGYGEAKAEEAFVIEAEKTTDVAVIFGVGKIKTSGTKGEGGAAITKSISWQVHKPSDDPDELGARVTTKGGSTMTSKLPTGDYVLKATYGYQTRRVPFTIAAERTTELVVPFEVGKLKISGLKAEGGAPVRESISWNIYPKGEDEDELGRRIDSKGGSEYKRALPAGDYIVKATYGEAKARKNVTIQTGETTTDVLVFNSAKLKLEAASPRGVQWAVFAEPEDDTDERERITSGGGKSKSFVIPAGKYLIEATSAGEKKQVRVELAAGDKKTVDVAFE